MSKPPVSPNTDFVYSLFTGAYKSQLMRIALTLDVFTPLASGPTDAQAVAQTCGCSPVGIQRLLDYLSAIGVIERQSNNYALTLTAATFLVPQKKSYVGDVLLQRTSSETVEGYLESIRSGLPSSPVRHWAQEAGLQSFGSQQPAMDMWRLAGFKLGGSAPRRVIDLACGCAIKSLVLARADPLIQIVCVDSPDVLEVARDLATRLGVLSQVVFVPDDILTMDLGDGQYDAALLGQITHYFSPEQNIGLFKQVRNSLVQTGVLVIDVPLVLDASDEGGSFGAFFLWATSGGKSHSFAEYREWLVTAGFQGVRQFGPEWLLAHKS